MCMNGKASLQGMYKCTMKALPLMGQNYGQVCRNEVKGHSQVNKVIDVGVILKVILVEYTCQI